MFIFCAYWENFTIDAIILLKCGVFQWKTAFIAVKSTNRIGVTVKYGKKMQMCLELATISEV